jgi:predicted nucleotidyltransferase
MYKKLCLIYFHQSKGKKYFPLYLLWCINNEYFCYSNSTDLLDTLISSKTRIKLLLKFFLNSSSTSYLRGLESEFSESSNAIRIELNRLEDAGMLTSESEGNRKVYRANTKYPLFSEIHSIIRKYIGLDTVITDVIHQLGNVEKVYLVGTFARGIDGPIIDLVIIGDIDKSYLIQLIDKAEPLIQRRIRYVVFDAAGFERNADQYGVKDALLIWKME